MIHDGSIISLVGSYNLGEFGRLYSRFEANVARDSVYTLGLNYKNVASELIKAKSKLLLKLSDFRTGVHISGDKICFSVRPHTTPALIKVISSANKLQKSASWFSLLF